VRPVICTPFRSSDSRSIDANSSAGRVMATAPVYARSSTGIVPETSMMSSSSARRTVNWRRVPRAEVRVRSMTVRSGVAGPTVMRHASPSRVPGRMFRSTALSLTVSALTSAP
jgi:hypothetical protein